MKKISVLVCFGLVMLTMNACKKDSASNASTSYSVRMTDGPGPYNAVFIDLQGVEVTGTNGAVVLLNVKAGIYNLLNFSNGVDTLIATGGLTISSVSQIRLILGTNNSVIVNNVSYPLSTPSADQTGLKLQVNQTLQAGVDYTILLDFDANASIVDQGNGTYRLKPVIRTIDAAVSGSIKGNITPVGTVAYVTATSSTSLFYTSSITGAGNFILKGVAAGLYTVTVIPATPLSPVSRTNVTVTTGVTADLGKIAL